MATIGGSPPHQQGDGLLAEVSLRELSDLITEKIAAGYESEKQEGRRRLRAVVDGLSEAEVHDADDLLEGRAWRLAEVAITGVGGIATLEPTPVSFTPTPGVTIVRGPNGHGKTSMARAIDCGLRGEGDVPDEVVGRLWTADLLTEDEDRAAVDLTLVGGNGTDELVIHAVFWRIAAPSVTATLRDADGTREVAPGAAWRRALLGAQVCYSYGALQSRLTLESGLQEYLEELLVLGPAWQEVRAEVQARAQRAMQSQKAVDAAARTAAQREKELKARYAADERAPAPPPSITWPRSKDDVDPDRWLRETGLGGDVLPVSIRVAADHETRVEQLDAQLSAADDALAAAERTLDSEGVRAALHHLEQIVAIADLDDGTCPLCGAVTNWRAHARELTASLQDRARAAAGVQRAISAVVAWVESELAPLLAAGVPGGPQTEVAALRKAAVVGHHPHSPAHLAVRSLLDVLRSEGHEHWVGRLRASSDATAEWRGELGVVVNEFASVLRDHGAEASRAGMWRKAEETLDELQVELRQRRQDAVTGQLHNALARMLPDAEIELASIRHPGGVRQQRGVDVGLSIAGRKATLGMLSSGQRNALLLAPLLILDAVGPFGFLVVDDPVHALDDLRVDLLTAELARLAHDRQVIVMTHDARVEEHLRARIPEATVIELNRDPRHRAVTWSAGTPWDTLLDDALEVSRTAGKEGWRYSESVGSVVAGLCRAAVDGALRQTVINRTARRRENVEEALAALGEKRDTRKRIQYVLGLAGGGAALPALENGSREHLTFWNQGSHGQLPPDVDLEATIAAAQAACTELVAYQWSTP